MVARKTQKRKKAAPLPRKNRTGLAAAPTKNFHAFQEYFRLDLERKEIAGVLRTYIKDNYAGDERKLLLSGPDHAYTSHYGAASGIQWKNLGYDFPEKYDGEKAAALYIENVRYWAEKKAAEQAEEVKTPKAVRSPMDIVKERTSDFIGEVEAVLDDFHNGVYQDIENYSVYNEMIKADLNSFSAKHVLDYYVPLQKELEELINDKTEDLVEGYSHMTVPQRKKYLKFVQLIVDDSKRYVLSKKAKRAPSKPRVKSADKQIAKLNYAIESSEFKLTSINPTQIIGGIRLFTFNVKERIITEYITQGTKGFEVSGTSLKQFDPERSRSVRLRKPDESLTIFLTKPKTQIHKHWDTLTTKTVQPTGRINKDTILLRIMES